MILAVFFLAVPRIPNVFWSTRSSGGKLGSDADFGNTVVDLLNQQTEPHDVILLRRGCTLSLGQTFALNRGIDSAETLADAVNAAKQSRGRVLWQCRPIPADELNQFSDLLRSHPVTIVGQSWLVDLHRTDPGIIAFSAPQPKSEKDAQWTLRRWSTGTALPAPMPRWGQRELELDLAHNIVPTRERWPQGLIGPPSSRPDLLARFNFLVLAGSDSDRTEKASLRARLMQGLEPAPRTFADPAPFGRLIGARWDKQLQRLLMVWECDDEPPRADDFALRATFRPLTSGKTLIKDLTAPIGCQRRRGGDLADDAQSLRRPARGIYALDLEVTRPGAKARIATGHLLTAVPTLTVP